MSAQRAAESDLSVGHWLDRTWRRIEIAVTCNWFTVALHCRRMGHDWRLTAPTRCVEVTTCAWCGQFRGARLIGDGHCRWYRPSTPPGAQS